MKYSLLFFFVASTLLLPQTGKASCIQLSVEEQVEMADVVVLGTATDEGVSVEQYFKGQGGDTLRVSGRVDPQAITSVDFELVEGTRYLLFLQRDNGTFRTDACSGSKVVEGNLADEEREILGAGRLPASDKNSLEDLLLRPSVLLLILAWSLPWKAFALWRSARRGEKIWFFSLLVVSSLGLLEILYLFVFSRRKIAAAKAV